MKWDGHTHTEYCPHGSVDSTEELIKKAIKLGFTRYSITEHAPLPNDFAGKTGGPSYPIETAGIHLKDVDHYVQHMQKLKKKYASEIEILVGFEVDYHRAFQGWTKDFLNEYGSIMDDGILSVHFLDGKNGLRAIDYTPEDYEEGLVHYHGGFQSTQSLYFEEVLHSMQADLGKYKPRRIGHISLCQKFQLYFPAEEVQLTSQGRQQVREIIARGVQENYQFDFNMAGLFKEYCQATSPPLDWIDSMIKKQIHWVYGSDTHDSKDSGRGYSVFEKHADANKVSH